MMRTRALLVLVLASSCAGSQALPGRPDPTPAWVVRGSAALVEPAPAFEGVGTSTGIKSVTLGEETARRRAISELARIVNEFLDISMRPYRRLTERPAETDAFDCVVPSRQLEFGAATKGAKLTFDAWTHAAADPTRYALARVELSQIEQAVAANEELPAAFRTYFRKHNREAFSEALESLGARKPTGS